MIKILTILTLFSSTLKAQVILDASQSTNASRYEWKQLSGTPAQLDHPDSVKCTVNGLLGGNYSFKLIASNEISKDSDIVRFDYPFTTIRVVGMKVKIVSSKVQPMRITLVNTVGQIIDKREVILMRGENYFELNKPAQGLYFVRFSNNEFNQTEKIIVE